MKKLLIFITVFALMCSLALGVSATEGTAPEEGEEIITEGKNAPDTENATEGEILGESGITEPQEVTPISAQIIAFLEQHIDSASILSLVGTAIVYIFYEIKQRKMLKGSIGTLNNNAVQIATKSVESVGEAFAKAQTMLDAIQTVKEDFTALMDEVKKSSEEKETLADTIQSVNAFMKALATAMKEISAEELDILMAANIPTAKKSDMYERHKEAEQLIDDCLKEA